jgi:hypothetical protein
MICVSFCKSEVFITYETSIRTAKRKFSFSTLIISYGKQTRSYPNAFLSLAFHPL